MNWLVLIVGIVGLLAVIYIAVCIFLARIVTGPDRSGTWPLRATPADVGLPFEDVSFLATDGLRISGWWLPASGGAAVVMIPGGGLNRLNDHASMGDVTMDNLQLAAALVTRGHGVLMYDPRGTGGSEGRRLSFGSLESRDLVSALDWLASRGIDADRVAVLSWSMGCATAMFVLGKRTYAGLIADSPLGGFSTDDVVQFASHVLPLPKAATRPLTIAFMHGVFLAGRLLWGMRLAEQPVEKLRSHPIPTLVIHGRADRTIPVRVGEQVAEAAGAMLIGAHFLDGVDHCKACQVSPDWYVSTVESALNMMFRGTVEPTKAGQVS